jgi:hypothetical protein
MGIGIPFIIHDHAVINLMLSSLSFEVIKHIHHPGEIGIIGHVREIGGSNLCERNLIALLTETELLELPVDQIDIDHRKRNGQQDDNKGDLKDDRSLCGKNLSDHLIPANPLSEDWRPYGLVTLDKLFPGC